MEDVCYLICPEKVPIAARSGRFRTLFILLENPRPSLPLSGTLCWNQGVADAVESRAVENQRTPPSFDAGSSRRRTGRLCERTWASR